MNCKKVKAKCSYLLSVLWASVSFLITVAQSDSECFITLLLLYDFWLPPTIETFNPREKLSYSFKKPTWNSSFRKLKISTYSFIIFIWKFLPLEKYLGVYFISCYSSAQAEERPFRHIGEGRRHSNVIIRISTSPPPWVPVILSVCHSLLVHL